MRYWLIEVNNMQYVVLLANKRDTSDRYWKTFRDKESAMRYADEWENNQWFIDVHELHENLY
jgi:hypothetical protein